LNVKTADADLALANYYAQTGNFTQAEEEITNSIRVHPNNPELRATLVRVYMSEGKEPEAESAAKEARDRFSENSSGYQMLGDLYFAAGDYAKALVEYQSLYRKHSGDLQVRKNLIQLLIINNEFDRAQKLNAEILEASPHDPDALDDDAQIDLHRGDAPRAIKTLQSAIQSNSENALLYYHLGIALDQTGSSAEAVRCWRKAVRLRADLTQAQIALAKSAMRDGDMPALEQAASELVRLLPALPDGYAMRAFSRTKQGHFALAEQDAEKAISVSPGSAQGYIQMGNLRAAEKHEDDALQFYREALDRAPNSAEALNGLVNVYLGQNQPAKALSAIEERISKAPQSSAFYDLLGTTRFEHRRNSGDLQNSEAELRKSTELDGHNADAWLKLGQVQAARGAVDDAIASSKQGLQQNPKQVALYVLIGRLYERKGELEPARQSYQQAVNIDPANPQACNALAHLLAQTGGNLDLALSLAQTAHRALPDAASVSDTMGWILYRQGAYKSAIALFQQAVKAAQKSKSSDDPTLHYHLALAYAKDRQQGSASRELERALKTDPSFPGAAEVRRLLEQVRE
jgi:tetratricopeptide (TPR) repeat protein